MFLFIRTIMEMNYQFGGMHRWWFSRDTNREDFNCSNGVTPTPEAAYWRMLIEVIVHLTPDRLKYSSRALSSPERARLIISELAAIFARTSSTVRCLCLVSVWFSDIGSSSQLATVLRLLIKKRMRIDYLFVPQLKRNQNYVHNSTIITLRINAQRMPALT